MKILCVDGSMDSAQWLKDNLEGVARMKQHRDWPAHEYVAVAAGQLAGSGLSGCRLAVVGEAALQEQGGESLIAALREQNPGLPVVAFSSRFSDRFQPKDEGLAALGVECVHSGQGVFELFHRIHKKLSTRPEPGASLAVG